MTQVEPGVSGPDVRPTGAVAGSVDLAAAGAAWPTGACGSCSAPRWTCPA